MREDYFSCLLEKYSLVRFSGPEETSNAGRWLSLLSQAYQMRLEALCGKYKRGRQRTSHFTFIINDSLNACADIYKEQGLVLPRFSGQEVKQPVASIP